MTDFKNSEAQDFLANISSGNRFKARTARGLISGALLKTEPDLREVVDEDVQALLAAAVKERGFADMHDLVREGYSQHVALQFAERIAAAHRAATSKSERYPAERIDHKRRLA